MPKSTIDSGSATGMVVLRTWKVLKEDLKASLAECPYGTTLRVQGEFFSDGYKPVDYHLFIEDFRAHIRRRIRPTPTTQSFKELFVCTHIFLRVAATK